MKCAVQHWSSLDCNFKLACTTRRKVMLFWFVPTFSQNSPIDGSSFPKDPFKKFQCQVYRALSTRLANSLPACMKPVPHT
eukprot:458788-Pelagomonas_calceolata.AAC.1